MIEKAILKTDGKVMLASSTLQLLQIPPIDINLKK